MRSAREKQGKTQSQIAEDLADEGIERSQPAVANWENDVSLPRTDEIRTVAKVYKLRPEQLLPRKAREAS